MRNRALILAAAVALPFLAAPRAVADVVFESMDAGDLPLTAFFAAGNGALARIDGSLSSGTDADMYAIYISDPAAFSASTQGGNGVLDTQLFLFDANGYGVSANDDIANGNGPYNPRSRIAAGSTFAPTAPGVYYIAISGWDRDPHSAGGAIFTDDSNYAATVGPTNVGGGQPISGWDSNGDLNGGVGAYRLHLTGTTVATPVPETPTLALAAMGLFATLRTPRRRGRPAAC